MSKSKQTGLTLIGFVVVLSLVGFFAFIGMKLFPVYTEWYSVRTDMKAIAGEPGVANKSPAEIRKLLFRRFYVSYVENVKQEHVAITRKDGYNLRVAWEVRRPLFGNLDFVAKFDETVDLLRQENID